MKDVKSLLRKKKLAGKEAAALLLINKFEFVTSAGKTRLLSEAESQLIYDNVTPAQAKDFNVFNRIGEVIFEKKFAFDVVKYSCIAQMNSFLQTFFIYYWIGLFETFSEMTPVIMTTSQYEEWKKTKKKEPKAGIAIIQNPKPFQLQENGHFKPVEFRNIAEFYSDEEEFLEHLLGLSTSTEQALFACFEFREIVRAYSDVFEIDLAKYVDYGDLESKIKEFNNAQDVFEKRPIGKKPFVYLEDRICPKPEAVGAMREYLTENIRKAPWIELFNILEGR